MRRHVDPSSRTALMDEFTAIWDAIARIRGGMAGLVEGDLGGTGDDNSQAVYVQPTAPSAPAPYIWIQTGLGPGGNDFTIWIEDGI